MLIAITIWEIIIICVNFPIKALSETGLSPGPCATPKLFLTGMGEHATGSNHCTTATTAVLAL